MKIGIYANTEKDAESEVTSAIVFGAKNHGFSCVDIKIDGIDGCDLVTVIGGDGTMLDIAKICALKGIPVLGVNKGYLGFLTEIVPSEIDEAFDKIAAGDFAIEKRYLMEVKVGSESYFALNEALIRRESLTKLCKVNIRIDEAFAGEVKGDGVIVSTPTGSTAYSLSCGGPVISPKLNVMAIVAVCPHSLHNIPIVTSGDSVVKLSSEADDVRLIIDGRDVCAVEKGDCASMTVSGVCANFVRFSNQNFYDRLLKKMLKW